MNELTVVFIFVDTVLAFNHLFSLIYVSCLEIHKSDSIYWIRYTNHLFSYQHF